MSATRLPTTVSLSVEQAAAAHAGPVGAFLIAAGPGTGKTFTAVERFCWLVEQGVAPNQILTVTFNDRAAEELRQRIAKEMGVRQPELGPEVLDGAWIGTFHGTCARLLDEFAYLVGAPREMKVLDETGQRLFEQQLIAGLRSGAAAPFDPDSFTALAVEDLDELLRSGLRFLLKLKGRGITPEPFHERALELHAENWRSHNEGKASNGSGGPDPSLAELEAIEVLFHVYETYETSLRTAGVRDFDDLILEVTDSLQRVPEFRRRCRERFRYLLVDEFQDTNRIQLDLIRLLAAENFGNVAVVGDAKQSIYGWRDAEIENIRSRFPGKRLPLTHNRRSFQGILDCATDFIRRDPDFAAEPDLIATRGSSPWPVTVIMAPDSRTEARSLAQTIRRLHVEGRAFAEIAILAHSIRMLPREFEDELRRQGIPYITSGGSGFFDRQEIKDVLALLRLTENPMDDGAFVRILQGPIVRLPDDGMYRLAARRSGRSGMRLRDCFDESGREGFPEMDPKVAREGIRLVELTDRLGRLRDALTVADILYRLLEESGYLRWAELRAQRDGSPRALLNLRKVFQLAGRFERDLSLAGIGDFVRHLDQVIDAELPVGEAAEEAATTEAVSLLTIHSAKGLEFPVVFLANLRPPRPRDTERLFFDPDALGFVMKNWRGEKHPRYVATSPGAPAVKLAIGERRRIVYVGLTRARDALYVTATREEPSAREVGANGLEDHDHFAEILSWALANPESAAIVEAEQLELPAMRAAWNGHVDGGSAVVSAVLDRLEQLRPRQSDADVGEPREVELSFSQLHDFEVCPVRYRFSQVWQVPAPPDELQPRHVQAMGSTELGSAVHAALASWHASGGDLLELYAGPEAGREMLARYLTHPLAAAKTLAVEVGFNMRIGATRVRGLVDRICELDGQTLLVDYKTNASFDATLIEAYSVQLRLYGLAARRGLVPGGAQPRLVLFDIRRGEMRDVAPDDAGVEARVRAASARIAAGDFSLGPDHADRPCHLCAFRPICPDARPR
jgi:DNA helicase-2/ATP-dependent DNA helicase PcrA